MQIERIELRRIQIPLKRAFKHAAHERHHTDAILVAISDADGHTGWGEIKPREYVTGETITSVLEQTAPALADALVGQRFGDPKEVVQWLEATGQTVGRAFATLSGFDLALLDLAGQYASTSIETLLGGRRRDSLPAGVIVGFEHPTATLARYCATLRLSGKKHVKVKVGLDDDAERLAAVAKVFKKTPIRIDANAAWTTQDAIEKLNALASVAPIASIEQPIAADDLEGLARIRRETGIAVMADESVCTLDDAQKIVAAEAADIFNVRLGKNGGFLASKRLVEFAEANGVQVHLGTMVGESGVLSAAGVIFGRCIGDFACLDGKGQNRFLLEVDICRESSEHPAPTAETGSTGLAASPAPGLGISIDLQRVEERQIEPARRFGSGPTETS